MENKRELSGGGRRVRRKFAEHGAKTNDNVDKFKLSKRRARSRASVIVAFVFVLVNVAKTTDVLVIK